MISLDPDVLEHPNTSIPDKGTIDNRPYRKSVVYEITFRGGATVVRSHLGEGLCGSINFSLINYFTHDA